MNDGWRLKFVFLAHLGALVHKRSSNTSCHVRTLAGRNSEPGANAHAVCFAGGMEKCRAYDYGIEQDEQRDDDEEMTLTISVDPRHTYTHRHIQTHTQGSKSFLGQDIDI
jgi:hypothetical protein